MIVELGHFALMLALGVALVQAVAPLIGWFRHDARLMATATSAARAQFVAIVVSYLCLTWAFISKDFSVAYVAQNNYSEMPFIYRLTAVWGAHEGSMLLWVLVLAGWTFAVSVFNRRLPSDMRALVLSVLGFVSIGFLAFVLLTSDPFTRLFPVPADGSGLNPILQDPGMASHPPMLYMGYVGFSVAFAFAIAALITGRLDAAWARWARPWTTAAWVFLTLGITIGSWWSYHVLGWGGWWFWDPVENASFMPWLAGTALIHSLAVTEKRGLLKSWTVLLSILAFSLCLFGTFLVRSGVLVSVHAFASDPSRGLFVLGFIGAVVGVSLALYAWRAPRFKADGELRLWSREGFLLFNNVFLAAACGAVLLGELYPLIVNAVSTSKISVGPPYFNTVFFPLFGPLFVLLGFAGVVAWKRAQLRTIVQRLRIPLLLALVAAAVLPFALVGKTAVTAAAGGLLAVWIITTAVAELWRWVRSRNSAVAGLKSISRATWGMTLAHIGMAVCLIGISFNSAFSIERDARMAPGAVEHLSGYDFSLGEVHAAEGPNYTALIATVYVVKDGERIATLHPQKRTFRPGGQEQTDAGVAKGALRDLYVSLGNDFGNGTWGLRMYVEPLVRFIWYGGLLMFIGGGLAATDPRYRLARAARRVRVAADAAAETA
ncbi:MAG: heme lyase CcmF/NrfE family subunit [Nevskiaceae bacterium]|nr:MAG: heme lyase CcmF/NrfE family subunit [Nevskiaceae bacterium]TBR73909.1 MAG: heme lyase CcmF/NrfE family subunit [Nevskiaceae bacterium]